MGTEDENVSVSVHHLHTTEYIPLSDVTAYKVTLAQNTRLVIFVHGTFFMRLAEIVHVALARASGVDLSL